jgi:allantoin racemase
VRIWLQKHVIEDRLPELDDWYRSHIATVVDPATEVATRTLPRLTYQTDVPYQYVTYGAVAVHFNHYFAQSAVQAERDGFDAWVIAAGQDPGLPAARTLATIPTLGYGNTVFGHCARDEIRFGIIGFASGLREPIVENVRRYRTDHLLANYSVIPGGKEAVVAAIVGKPEQFLDEFGIAAAQAAAAGAQVIIPAEGLPAEVLWHYNIRTLAGLPVLDPLGLLLKSAENEVRLRALGCVARPTTGFWYARPDRDVTEHIESVFATTEIEQGFSPIEQGSGP